jgi:hypothetical protein
VKPGDVVTITGHRYRDGSKMAVLKTIVLANGKELYYASRP